VQKLLAWCKRRGIRVVPTTRASRISYYYHDEKLIELEQQLPRREQLIALLHECGHYLIEQSGGTEHAAGDLRTKVCRQAVLADEMRAWDRGLRLARRLGIRIPLGVWEATRAQYLDTYIRWVARRKT
jgi:hypothetical protein